MAAFLLADVFAADFDAYVRSGYIDAVPKIAAKYGGVYRARGGEMELLEGDWMPARMVVIEFPDMEKLKSFYNCEEYQPWKKIRQSLTTSKIIALEGV